MSRTLIQQHSSSILGGMIGRIESLKDLDHRLTKGELRELFISTILRSFLTSQFDIGTGIIINQKGAQSNQTDIIIYDNRILPPFIREQQLGVYPAESVLAAIEVKSCLNKSAILNAETSSSTLKKVVYDPNSSIYPEFNEFIPVCAIIGFYGTGVKDLRGKDEGKAWIGKNINNLDYLCLVNKWSWINIVATGWTPEFHNKKLKSSNETKRFIAVLLDNIRSRSEMKLNIMRQNHRDWLGSYIRD